ncbi:hypothetical protein Asppvi_010725 [Aspergillus pseudoviridinutans]|uniref:Heme haloperoxidase family profile domain-containing protein n=1 Tax=Aspergillus pseudoviridinutans TaxID=1517512 RepID=A0A9P3BMR6_9EURO|nr:uncharacterized protein Asppvi_010725 [Aspergillus pseudoviridinutans]GIJ91753.1 hypothetical protein Asppvi_010725 [Aspergillus pseudoviridinutans]
MVNFFTTAVGIFRRLIHLLITIALVLLFAVWLTIRDLYYCIANLFLPRRHVGSVVPSDHPGHGGVWPQFQAPSPATDSRSPCPALNALANHGILPRSGKHISYKHLSHAIQHAYNLAPSLADQLTASAYQLDQGRGRIDLQDLSALNVIQHDASFTRPDIAFCPDQGVPHPDLVDRFLSHASNGKSLSLDDIVYFSALRRAECRRNNGQYSMRWSFLHQFFGSGNNALMYSVFGGDVNDLRVWLAEERFPDQWEPRNREARGHTIMQAMTTTLIIELNINEKQKLRSEAREP